MPYTSISGWDDTKLNSEHDSPKYRFMRAVQDLGLPVVGLDGHGDRAAMSARLGDVAAKAGAQQVGDDKLDFGDGFGPQDVLTGQGQWWWEGNGGKPGGGQAPAAAPAASGGTGGAPSIMGALSRLGSTVGRTPFVDPTQQQVAGSSGNSIVAAIAAAVAKARAEGRL